jgi:tyrosyl-tRNA synthetase
MSRLGESVDRTLQLFAQDLTSEEVVERLLTQTCARRHLDLSDLSAAEQAAVIAARAAEVLPSVAALGDAIETARSQGRPLTIKLGIDPTASDVHFGHAVPMLVLSRFQRMGHRVVLIVGDVTGKIGDPSGRSSERPPLTDADIAVNMATYRDQVSPFFDFSRAEFRRNSEWLSEIRLPELIEILARIPVSLSLQREDFRSRLAQGHGLAMSEFIYSVVMAIDSAKISADVELGGLDQLLNMQMGRKVMEVTGQQPQLVVAMPLIEGTDGAGRKMSKSLGNYIALAASPGEIFGKIMSIPDRLTLPYLRAWTEWTDAEIDLAGARVGSADLHPMELKKILAGEATAAVHGVAAAMAARRAFTAQFSRRLLGEVETLPVLESAAHGAEPVGVLLTRVLEFTSSISAARRMARQQGLRIVVESGGDQEQVVLTEEDVVRTLRDAAGAALATAGSPADAALYLKAGRKVARIDGQ